MLFLVDRQTPVLDLQLTSGAFEPCTVLSVTDTATGPHSIVLCDLDPIDRTALIFVESVIKRHASLKGVPPLYFSRRQGYAAFARAKNLGATAVMPRNASPHHILFTVRRPVEARTPAVCRPSPPVKSVASANIRQALSICTDIVASTPRWPGSSLHRAPN